MEQQQYQPSTLAALPPGHLPLAAVPPPRPQHGTSDRAARHAAHRQRRCDTRSLSPGVDVMCARAVLSTEPDARLTEGGVRRSNESGQEDLSRFRGVTQFAS